VLCSDSSIWIRFRFDFGFKLTLTKANHPHGTQNHRIIDIASYQQHVVDTSANCSVPNAVARPHVHGSADAASCPTTSVCRSMRFHLLVNSMISPSMYWESIYPTSPAIHPCSMCLHLPQTNEDKCGHSSDRRIIRPYTVTLPFAHINLVYSL